jgi:hypothetical protein
MTQGIAYTPDETERYKKQIVDYIAESIHGTFSVACHKFGVSKTIGYEWRAEDKEFDKAVNAARNSARQSGLDMAEGRLMKKIGDGDTTSILFYLKTQGKDRGYVEKGILAGDPENPLAPSPINVAVTSDVVKSIVQQVRDEF